VELEARIATVRMAETFVISRGASDEAEVVDVEIRHDGISGFGEAAPIERYDESPASALAFLEGAGELLGDDPFAFEAIEARLRERPGEHAAKAAVDAALHDLCGKLAGLSVWRLLGLRREGPPTSWTIWLGDPDDMARRAEKVEGRFKRLKLKLGAGDGLDVERVRAVRGVAEVPLQVDVNEAWSLDEALEALPQLAEDCHTLEDVAFCAERAHGLTVKLAKSGGIREAVRMAHAGRALGLGLMLGCMNESGLAVAAGAACASLFDHVDLDGNLLLVEDPWPGVELVDGVQLPSNEPGLGVREAVPDPR